MKEQNLATINAKEFLTIKDASILLNCSIRTAYKLIEKRKLRSVNIAQRKTLVKHTEIDKLLKVDKPINKKEKQSKVNLDECYTIGEIQNIYGVSSKALSNIIKRNNILKVQSGKFVYVPKKIIHEILT